MVIEILPEAESDIQAAYTWYFDISEVLANRFEAEVEKHLIAISQNYLHYENRYLSVRVCVLKKFPYSIHFYRRKSGYPYSSRYPSQKKSGEMV